ncbi:MAG: LysR family transcriptional regulator [Gammaproteobacteria bacterium RBG_16_57_12]|nr:MAG: LysR family transcriptional regulator [Gammaproteobacteria bacterium RBG_16_57_12]
MQTANLTAFIAVAETGSFSRAAGRLHLTQPAVSKRITVLEHELDTRLFDRIGHQVSLTEAGQALLPRARHIIGEIEDSRRAIHNLSGLVAGRLTIGTSHHIGLHRLPPVLRNYGRRFPDVELDLHFMASESICTAVSHGDLELGIVTLPLQTPEHLRAIPVWQDPLLFVCAPHHPLARTKKIAPAQLALHTAILPERQTTTREILEQSLARSTVELKTGTTTNNLEAIKMMVAVGLGWSVLPETLLDKQLQVFQVNNLRLSRTLGVVHHRDRTLSNAALRMLELLT